MNNLEIKIYRNDKMGRVKTNGEMGVFLCACASVSIAEEIAKLLARNSWRGYYVYLMDHEGTFNDYFYSIDR